MGKNGAKRYCIAAGCRTTDKNSSRSFFSLPLQQKHAERRQKWLQLLGREDLLGKSETRPTYFVCSAHFDRSAVKIVKNLKDTALPTKCLANQPQEPVPEDDIEDMEGEDTDDDDAPLSAISNPHKETNPFISIPPLPTSNKDIQVNIKLGLETPQTGKECSTIKPQKKQEILNEPQTEAQIEQQFSEQNKKEQKKQTKLVTKIPKTRKAKKKNASGHSWMKEGKEKY